MTKRKPPAPQNNRQVPDSGSSPGEVEAFLQRAAHIPVNTGIPGRLIFGLDATMSRQPSWDLASQLQADMFMEAGRIGGLMIQLIYFRGFRECRASKWTRDASVLAELMGRIQCRGGATQIGKVLAHVLKEAKQTPVRAVVYIGDCMEENVDKLCDKAGEIGLLGIPVFMFQENHDPVAREAFREIARLTGGAYEQFDSRSQARLRELLKAVAVYASGGRQALADFSQTAAGARKLLEQMK